MKATCRDLGRMDYEACWRLQRTLFDALLARKGADAKAGLTDPGTTGTQKVRTAPAMANAPETGPIGDKTFAESVDAEANLSEPAAAVHAQGHRMGTEQTFADRTEEGDVHEEKSAAHLPTGKKDETEAEGSKNPGAEDIGTVLLVEHPPVYTLGKSGHGENLLVAKEALETMGAQFFHIDRGGDITFHGPGQLVCYPILDLERIGMGLRDYVAALEEAVIRTAARYGITAGRIAGASGVWIEEKRCAPRKICAIGVRASRYVTMHGFALNVSTDLGWFARINPCGFTDRGVTSLERETGRKIAIDDVKKQIVRSLGESLGVRIDTAAADR